MKTLGLIRQSFIHILSFSSAFGIFHYLKQKGRQKPEFCFPWKEHMWSIFIGFPFIGESPELSNFWWEKKFGPTQAESDSQA